MSDFNEKRLLEIPDLGFGVGTSWFKGYQHNIDESPLQDELITQTINALNEGFNHLDLAEMYGNDREVQQALDIYFQTNNVSRENLWITSKVFLNMHQPIVACQDTLQRLHIEYLDLYLLHCPVAFLDNAKEGVDIRKVWQDMESMVAAGKVRFIGVSNFRIEDIEEILSFCLIKPYINQVEFNPYLQQPDLQAYCCQHGIKLSAYSPLGPITHWPGSSSLDDLLKELSNKYQNISIANILLQYCRLKGIVPITTTSKVDRLKEFLSIKKSDNPANLLTLADVKLIDEVGSSVTKRKYWTKHFSS